jgi:hypothetical protein
MFTRTTSTDDVESTSGSVRRHGDAAGLFAIDTRTPLTDFLKNLSKRPRVRPKSEDTQFDKLKEKIALCQSDYAILEWAEPEVFGASIRAKEVAEGKPPRELQPPDEHRALRIRRSAPRARGLRTPAQPLPSFYIFGCTPLAYNELLENR